MKNLLVAVLVGLAFLSGAQTISADDRGEQSQKLDQELKVECETGAYGQNTKCWAKGRQEAEQKQKIVVKERVDSKDRVLGKTHTPVDTALDTSSILAVSGIMLTGAGSFVLKRKLS